jgi:hypothetical protein
LAPPVQDSVAERIEMVEREPLVLSPIRVPRIARKSPPLSSLILAIQRMEDLVAFSIHPVDPPLDFFEFPRSLLVILWQLPSEFL